MNQFWITIWGTNLRKTLTSFLALITATATAIVAVPPAWQAMGLPEAASKSYVHEQVDPVKLIQADTSKAINILTLNQLQSSLYAAQQDMAKAPSATVQQRIDDLQRQIADMQAKINAGH
jgi:polyhydroxyalkanoate synthesis regulator phasin